MSSSSQTAIWNGVCTDVLLPPTRVHKERSFCLLLLQRDHHHQNLSRLPTWFDSTLDVWIFSQLLALLPQWLYWYLCTGERTLLIEQNFGKKKNNNNNNNNKNKKRRDSDITQPLKRRLTHWISLSNDLKPNHWVNLDHHRKIFEINMCLSVSRYL